MHFLILGAGGIGGYYGARLQAAGHQVTLVARGEHLQALQHSGLQVEHQAFQFHQAVNAIDEARLHQNFSGDAFDLILLTFKAGATSGWLERATDWLNACNTPVLSLQNGVDNEPEIARVIGQKRTLGGLARRIGGHLVHPGRVQASGPAQVVFGAWPAADVNGADPEFLTRLQHTFEASAIPTTLSPDIGRELWRKLLINNGVNPLSALTRLDTRTLTHDPGYRPAIRAMMEETAQAAAADGVTLSAGDVDEMLDLITSFDAIKTSMLVDLEKGRPLELDGISGAVLRRSAQLGMAAPVTGLVLNLLQAGATDPGRD